MGRYVFKPLDEFFQSQNYPNVDMKKIGILGGVFDPPHLGHLMMAQMAVDAFDLDKVFFVAAHRSPFKQKVLPASARDRLAMVRLAIRGNPKFGVSDIELRRGGVSYTIDTLRYFHQRYPKARLFFIIGKDNIPGLASWKDIQGIKILGDFIAIERDWFDVSSTLIRGRLKHKKSIRYLTPQPVVEYIFKKKLYR